MPAIRLAGDSGCGKTTLGERLVRALGERGLRVAVVKSARHHEPPADRHGADTARYAAAGAVAVTSAFRDEMVLRMPGPGGLALLLSMLRPAADLVLVDGFHDALLPVLLFAGGGGAPSPAAGRVLARVVARTSDACAGGADGTPPSHHRDDVDGIARAIERWLAVPPVR